MPANASSYSTAINWSPRILLDTQITSAKRAPTRSSNHFGRCYSLSGRAGTGVEIFLGGNSAVSGYQSDPYLQVARSTGGVVTQNDDGGGSLNSYLNLTWQNDYVIVATTFSAGATGWTRLLVRGSGTLSEVTCPGATATKLNQTITFNNPGTRTFGTSFTASASASSGLVVSFTSLTTGVCTVSGTTVSLNNAGTCTLRASQAGNTSYNAAPNVDQSFTVAKANQSITFGTPSNRTFSSTPFSISANASSGLTVLFTSATSTICSVSGTSVTMLQAGTCTINANQGGNSNYNAAAQVARSFSISKANQTITFSNPGTKTFGSNFTVAASSTSGLNVGISSLTTAICTISGTTVTPIGVGTCTLRAAQEGDDRFNAALAVENSFSITQVSQSITFTNPGTKTYGDAKFTLSATATSGLTPTFSSNTQSVCTVSENQVTIASAGTCTLTASQAGNSLYQAAPDVSTTFTINKKTITVLTTITSRIYNGTKTAGEINLGIIVGLVSTETINVSAAASEYASANVGTQSTTITYTLNNGQNGGLASNYQMQSTTVNGSITARPLTITAGDFQHTTDQTAPTFDQPNTIVTGNNLVSGETISSATLNFSDGSTTSPSIPARTTVGSYTIIPSNLVLQNGSASNYNITYVPGTYNITIGVPAKLAVSTFTGTAASGQAFSNQPVVTIQDAGNNTITDGATASATITATITSGANGALVGTVTAQAVEGVATFTNLGLTGSSDVNYTISYSSGSLTADTQTLSPTFGQPAKLRVSTLASGAQINQAFIAQPVIEILDAQNNFVSNANQIITVSLAGSSPTGTIAGTTSVQAVNGVATFSGLSISGTTGTFELSYQSAGFQNISQNLVVNAGTAAELSIFQPALGTAVGTPFATQPALVLRDSSGNQRVTSGLTVNATVAQVDSFGTFLDGTTSATATTDAGGKATFSNLGLIGRNNTPYEITFSYQLDVNTSFTTTQTVTVTTGAPYSFELDRPAAGASSGKAFTTQPLFLIRDRGGNIVTNATNEITAAVSENATLVGSDKKSAINGTAIFSGLGVSGTEDTYTLTYTSTDLVGVPNDPLTQTITLSAGDPSQIQITNAAGFSSGAPATTQPVITVKDASGNTVTDYVGSVTATLSSPDETTASLIGIQTRAFINGVATFSGLGIRGPTADIYAITFTSGVFTQTQSSISLTPGIATQLSAPDFSGSALSGAAFGTQPTITFLDSAGNITATSATVTATVSSGAEIVGTNTVSVTTQTSATFNNLGLSARANSYTLTYSATGLSSISQQVTVTTGAATAIAFDAAALGATSGASFIVQPKIKLVDSGGNTVTATSALITATITRKDAVALDAEEKLLGTLQQTTSSGIATFSNLGFEGEAGREYVITYSAQDFSSLTQEFTAQAGAANKLEITQSPTEVRAGAAFATNSRVLITDSYGNLVTSNAEVTLTSSLATLTGTTSVRASAGVATFSNLILTNTAPSTFTLTFASTGLTSATTASIGLIAGPADQLSVNTFASAISSGQTMTTGATQTPVVTIQDAGENTVADAINTVTATISNGATLQLATADAATSVSIPAAAGVATFTDLKVNAPVGTYTITFSSPSLTSTSRSIEVTVGDAVGVDFETRALGTASGAEFSTQPKVKLLDSGGNTVRNTAKTITATISGTNGTLTGTATAAVDTTTGIATFSDLGFTGAAGTSYTLGFTANDISTPITQSFSATVGVATKLVVAQSPTSIGSGEAFATTGSDVLTVHVTDSFGNLVTTSSAAISVAVSNGTLTGTTTIRASGGVVSFTDLVLSGIVSAGNSYILTFNSAPLPAITQEIGLTPGAAAQLVIEQEAGSGEPFSTTIPSGQAMTTGAFSAPRISIKDSGGNIVTTATNEVTATVSVGATLQIADGTAARSVKLNATAGVATFSNLKINGVNVTTYTITYSVGGLPSASQNISVVTGSASHLELIQTGIASSSGLAFEVAPKVALRDTGGNAVTSANVLISAAISTGGTLTNASVQTDASGIATFSNITMSGLLGTVYTITFSSAQASDISQSAYVGVGPASQLAVTRSSVGTASGAIFTTQPQISLQDSGTNLKSNHANDLYVEARAGNPVAVVGSALLQRAPLNNGVATFSGIGISGPTGNQSISYHLVQGSGEIFTDVAGITAATQTISVTVGAATNLTITSASTTAPSGEAFGTPRVVTVRDSGGNLVTTNSSQVTASVVSANGTLVGTTVVSAVDGIATFSSLGVSGIAGTSVTIRFTALGIGSVDEVVSVSAGSPVKLSFSNETPVRGSAPSGGVFETQPIIRATDLGGNFVNSVNGTVNATVTQISGTGVVVGTSSATMTSGEASFSSLGLTGFAGRSYVVTYSFTPSGGSPNLTALAETVEVSVGAETQLRIKTRSVGSASGAAFTTQPEIEIRDSGGNLTASSLSITATITPIIIEAVSTGELIGTRTLGAAAGVAAFTNLGITGTAGQTYTITYSSGALQTVTQEVTVGTGAPTDIVFNDASLGAGRAANSAQAFAVQPVIEIRDSGNNVVTSSSALVTATLTTTAPGASLGGTTQVNAVDGVVRFTDLSVTGLIEENDLDPYDYTLTYTYSVGGLTTTITEIVTLSPGTPSSISLGTFASGAASGAAFSTQPKINILDSAGNIVTTSLARVTTTLSKTGSLGTGEELVGTTFADAAAGVAQFDNLGISGLIENDYTITYAVAGLSSITQTLQVNVGAPTQLRFKTESVGSAAGAAFTTQPEIEIRDSGGNLTASTLAVTATITQINLGGVNTGQLIGTQSLNAAAGVASFSNLGITGVAGQTYTVTYSSGALQAVIQTVSVTPGQATQVGIVVGASGAVAGQAFVRQPQIAIQDAAGNTVTNSSETVRVAISEGGTLIGTTARAAVNGIVEFTNLGIRGNSGVNYTLSYSIGSFAPTTEAINLLAGPATQLTFSQAATGANSGAAFATQPRILIKDEFGNTVLSSSALVTATITQVGGFGALLGTTSVNAVNGVATFTNLGITGTNNTAYRVTYTAANIGVISENIVVSTGVGTTLELTQAAVGNTVGANFSVQPRLTIKDNAGNIVENTTQVVTASVSSGGEILGTTTLTPVNGITEFTNLALVGISGQTYTVTFTAGVLTRTQNITLVTGAPFTLELTTAAVGTTVDSIFSTQPSLTIKDRGGNTVSSVATVTATISQGGQLTGTTSRGSISGVSNFTNLGVSGTVGESYTVTYSAFGLPAVTQTLTLTAAEEALVPLLGATTSISNGFRLVITNFESVNYSWIASSTSGTATINTVSGVVTVSGLAPGSSANIEISASRNGYATGRSQIQGTAQLGAALNPAFAVPAPTSDGFSVQISNYSAAYTYVASVVGGTATVSATGLVRVTGIAPETNSVVTVSTQRTGYLPGSATSDATSLKAGLIPTFSTPTILDNGYSVQITNFDSSFTYARAVTSGATVVISDEGLITVSGLADGVSATTLVTTEKLGHAQASAAITANSTNPALVPEIGIPAATATGFLIPLTNYSTLYSWSVIDDSTTAISEIVITGTSASIRVNSLPEGEPVVVTITSARANYFSASTTLTLTLRQGLTPIFGVITPTINGFTAQITNYYSEAERNDLSYNWAIATSSGSATVNSTGLVTVSGLGVGTTAELTVTTSRLGYSTLSSSLTGASFNADGVTTPLPAGLVTTFSPATATSDGFTVTMSNYDAAFTYEVSVNQNGTVIRVGNLITVTGIEPGTASTIVVTTNRNGYLTGTASLTATSITGTGVAPTFGTATQLSNGYRVAITNFNSSISYEGTATNNGSVLIDADGFVTVSEVSGGIESVLTLIAAREGFTNATATFSAFSLNGPALVPIFDSPISNETGFSVAILNYDVSFTYTLSATNGGAATRTDGVITVSGLTRGDSSTLTVTTSRDRSASATATLVSSTLAIEGSSPALSVGLRPVFATPVATSDGFRVQITNFDNSFTFTRNSSAGIADISSTGVLTVTGATPNTQIRVVLYTNKAGHSTGSSSIVQRSLVTGTRNSNFLTNQAMDAICTWGSPQAEGVSAVNDLTDSTKYSCFNASNKSIANYVPQSAGFYTRDIGNVIVEQITFTSATDVPARDPITYSLWGCASPNSGCSVIVANDITGLSEDRKSDSTRTINNDRPFNFYRLTFGTLRGTASSVQIAEVAFQGSAGVRSALTPVFASPTTRSDGFDVQITNYSNLYTWSAAATGGSRVSISETGLVSVRGASPATSISVTVNSARSGYQNGIATTSVTTSSGAAFVPTLSNPVSTAVGFTTRITNFVADSPYVFAATTNAGSASINNFGLVTVTGLTPGSSADLTISVSRSGFLPGENIVQGAALGATPTPVLSSPAATVDGYTFNISNISAYFTAEDTSEFDWSLRASGSAIIDLEITGTTEADRGAVVTVSGLSAGERSTATLTVTRSGYVSKTERTTGTATLSGGSTYAALVPNFGNVVVTDDSLTFDITNYDPSFTWVVTSNDSDDLITVSDRNVSVNNSESTLTVTASKANHSTGSAVFNASLSEGLPPIFGIPVPTVDGFTVQIINFDSQYLYQAEADLTANAIISETGLVTVSGVAAGRTARVVATSSRDGYLKASAAIESCSIGCTSLTPTFALPISVVSGFLIQISNFDESYDWDVLLNGPGSVGIDASGLITVTGLNSGQSAEINVTTSRVGSARASATTTGISRLAEPRIPIFGSPASSATGFSVQINNYSSDFEWVANVDSGAQVAITASGLLRVTGAPGLTLVNTTVTSSRAGFNPGTASVSATTLPNLGLTPRIGVTESNGSGFKFSILNFDQAYQWSVTASQGTAELNTSTGVVSVSGVTAGQSSTVVVETTRPGFTKATRSVSATALANSGLIPIYGEITSSRDSGSLPILTIPITNYSNDYTWTVSSSLGLVTFDAGLITVTGLTEGQVTSITVNVSRAGYLSVRSNINAAYDPETPTQDSVVGDLRFEVTLSADNRPVPVTAVVTIPAGTFSPSAEFGITPVYTAEIDRGYRVIKVSALDGGAAVSELDQIMRILFEPSAPNAIPAYSQDNGLTWILLEQLSQPDLLPEQRDGYFVNEDGTYLLMTRHLTLFGVIAPQGIPVTLDLLDEELEVGEVTVATVGGGEGDGDYEIISNNTSICTVDEDGTVTAIARGDCSLTATKAGSGIFLPASTTENVNVLGFVAGGSVPRDSVEIDRDKSKADDEKSARIEGKPQPDSDTRDESESPAKAPEEVIRDDSTSDTDESSTNEATESNTEAGLLGENQRNLLFLLVLITLASAGVLYSRLRTRKP